MVTINSNSRFSPIKSLVVLTQTDTTVGFLSQDATKLQKIKNRPNSKPFIKVFQNFRALKSAGIRIPNLHKRAVRNAKKSTFVVKNIAFRVAEGNLSSTILRKRVWNYSTSANASGKQFERDFCEEKADIIVENKFGLYEGAPSSLYKINNKRREKLR